MSEMTPERLRPWTPADCEAAASNMRLGGHDGTAEVFELIASAWKADRKVAEWKHAFDKGEVVGLGATGMETDNPYPEGSNEYCGWSFGFWSGRSLADRQRIEVLEKVLRQAEGSLRLAMVTMPESAQRDVLVEDWLAVGDVLGAKKETLKIEPMSELETAYMDLKGKLAAAEARIEALESDKAAMRLDIVTIIGMYGDHIHPRAKQALEALAVAYPNAALAAEEET